MAYPLCQRIAGTKAYMRARICACVRLCVQHNCACLSVCASIFGAHVHGWRHARAREIENNSMSEYLYSTRKIRSCPDSSIFIKAKSIVMLAASQICSETSAWVRWWKNLDERWERKRRLQVLEKMNISQAASRERVLQIIILRIRLPLSRMRRIDV